MRLIHLLLALLSLSPSDPAFPPSQPEPEACRPAPTGPSATEWLRRAEAAVGLPRLGARTLTFEASDISIFTYQSDRMYPPYLHSPTPGEWWFDGRTGVERFGPPGRARQSGVVRSRTATFQARDTMLIPAPPLHGFMSITRELNPLAMLMDWRGAEGLRVAEQCLFRDYWRTVVARADGARLYLDTKTAIPVKVERVEPHFLWGQVRVAYLYTTWWAAGPVVLPISAFRVVDGETEMVRSLSITRTIARTTDSTPVMTLPPFAPDMSTAPHPMLSVEGVDTVRVAPNVFLLRNRAYTETVVLARDTVWLLDATQNEDRARADSAWIARLFPGRHPVAVVVTDLAWPHIAGVRFWVARGATIVTHRLSRDFLDRVIARPWTVAPDALERIRPRPSPRFRLVADSMVLAGGDLRLYVVDGAASEGALMAWVPAAGYLWAGDYIQTTADPSLYATEVWQAVRRAGFRPERVAAQHLPLTPWERIEQLGPALAPGPGAP
jgi:hypothetical protein